MEPTRITGLYFFQIWAYTKARTNTTISFENYKIFDLWQTSEARLLAQGDDVSTCQKEIKCGRRDEQIFVSNCCDWTITIINLMETETSLKSLWKLFIYLFIYVCICLFVFLAEGGMSKRNPVMKSKTEKNISERYHPVS